MASTRIGGANEDRQKRADAVRERILNREQNVLDKNMDYTLKAMNREYAELRKKQSDLKRQKSTTGHLGEGTVPYSKRSARDLSSRSNLATPSSRNIPSSTRLRTEDAPASSNVKKPASALHPKDETQGAKPGQTVQKSKDVKAGPAIKITDPSESSKKGKGKGKTTVVPDESTVKASEVRKSDPTQKRETTTAANLAKLGAMGRRGSSRRESITGQSFSREEMEEQQRILDLFIHLVEKVDKYVFDPEELSAKLKDMAIEHKQKTAAPITRATTSERMAALPHLQRLHEDPKVMGELKEMLNTRRQSMDLARRGSESSESGHHGKRRVSGMEMLSDILGAYKTQYKEVKFDPLAMLNCGYLRLSKSNVRELERLCREQGVEPGIHVHSDVHDYRLFDDKEDAEGEQRAAQEK